MRIISRKACRERTTTLRRPLMVQRAPVLEKIHNAAQDGHNRCSPNSILAMFQNVRQREHWVCIENIDQFLRVIENR
jgi:hypothetical protein